MLKTSDGIEVPAMLVLANRMADAAGAVDGDEAAKRKAGAVETAFAVALLFERHPDYAQQMLMEFRWWTMRERHRFPDATILNLVSGGLYEQIDAIPQWLPVELPHGTG